MENDLKITKENYKLVLGLEIHLHLNTKKKMFCLCNADIWEREPNTVTCPVCLGLPGALPVPNEEAIRKTQILGLALGCSLNENSRFDRKHYFYPDLPKGYQISQYKQPLCKEGVVELDNGFKVEIERVHLEEDVAKSFHKKGKTFLDFNKSGVPLVEIVTKPIFSDVKDAVEFCKKVQYIVRFLGIGDVDMEKGQMRLEANISLRTKEMEEKGELASYKVEIKNINSFRFMERAVNAEVERQLELFKKGIIPVQENRGFDEDKGVTVSQRSKEEAKDYRYFPEPDIPSMVFDSSYIESIKKEIPELPYNIKNRFIADYKIPNELAVRLVNNLNKDLLKKYEHMVKLGLDATKVANVLINKKETRSMPDDEFSNYIGGEKNLINDDKLEEVIKKALELNQKAVADYKNGKKNSLQFLIGQVMKETKGNISPDKVKEALLKALS
ncbi:Asp-tRNA(Asn)/Glu-tRNA(Gln) amidotransferase subunit GatB [candidate division WWE3 bacterium]|uniref:Aspartyl/glutamyl-tRNA(Asn/Gln) amidotransferase subunit B n=1 Tax=candidate division WWE3 bacterium TaxID=2053526 RepID=A0A7X9HTW7_UNCKA|nr:Asp-tRNA(Asn)/Glu-tRNA(Gln) amidotransferase subunit GatB [candidate division WWE3 bacterium]